MRSPPRQTDAPASEVSPLMLVAAARGRAHALLDAAPYAVGERMDSLREDAALLYALADALQAGVVTAPEGDSPEATR